MKKIIILALICLLLTSCADVSIKKVAKLNGVYTYEVSTNFSYDQAYTFTKNAFGDDAMITQVGNCFIVTTKTNMFGEKDE